MFRLGLGLPVLHAYYVFTTQTLAQNQTWKSFQKVLFANAQQRGNLVGNVFAI